MHGPHVQELIAFEPLGEQAQSVAVPHDQIRSTSAEHKQMTGERILLQHLLRQHGKAIHALAHARFPCSAFLHTLFLMKNSLLRPAGNSAAPF